MKDFFTRYRESRKNHVILPVFLALGVSFLTVATLQGTPIDLKSLSANVAGGLSQEVAYKADLMMENGSGNLSFRIGKNASAVKKIYFSLLGDPSIFTNVKSKHSNVTISMNEPGVALIIVDIGKDLKAGDIITELTPTLTGKTPLTIIDAGLSSETGEYNLSSSGE